MELIGISASAALAAVWHGLVNAMFQPDRPERYFMRGPGPKWQERRREGKTV